MDDLAGLFKYLLECSKVGLQNVQLKRLNEAANLEKEMCTILDAWVNARAGALLAELLRVHGEELTGHSFQLTKGNSNQLPDAMPQPNPRRDAAFQAVNSRFMHAKKAS
jgi:hypothetical protein